MTDLIPTPARLSLMRALAAGEEVVYMRGWGKDPDEVRWGRANVTRQYEALRKARLVELGPATHASMYAPKHVRITDEGKRWLAEHDKEM